MSLDLAHALRTNVDRTSVPDVLAEDLFDLADLTGRIRRRRTVRAGVRGAAGVGVAGAVVIGAQVAGGRGPDGTLPAAVPGAEPGTCGSDLDALPDRTSLSVALTPVGETADRLEDTIEPGARASDIDWDVPVTITHDRLLQIEVTDSVLEGVLTLSDVGPVAHTGLLVARDGVVVGRVSPTTSDAGISVTYEDGGTTWRELRTVELVTCAPSADGTLAAGSPLPTGSYDAIPTGADLYGDLLAVGPGVRLTVLPVPAPVSAPEGYPAAEVPVVGVGPATFTPTTTGDPVWLVEVGVDRDDALVAAMETLAAVPGTTVDLQPWTYQHDARTPHWNVRVTLRTADDGSRSLAYVLIQR